MADEEQILDDGVKEVLSRVSDKWNDPSYEEDISISGDWRSIVYAKKKEGDVSGMIKLNAAQAEYNIMEIANESEDEKVRLDANKFIVSQAGHGPLQKVEHNYNMDEMTPAQLIAIVKGKAKALKDRDPNFDLQKLLSGPVIDGEFEEVPEDVNESADRDSK